MTKRRPEIINALHEFGRLGQGNRRRNSCYAFLETGKDLDLKLIRRHPITAFWAYADSVGGITPAQNNVKAGSCLLVEMHLYVPQDGTPLTPARRHFKRATQRDQPAYPEDPPIPDREPDFLNRRIDI